MRVQTDGGSGAANAPIIYEPTMAEPPMIGLVLLVGVPLVIGVVVLIMSLVKGSRTGERTPTEATASARRAARARGRRT